MLVLNDPTAYLKPPPPCSIPRSTSTPWRSVAASLYMHLEKAISSERLKLFDLGYSQGQ